jgi:2-amino-4-hydroxy-6-hydroxymethyldihydropteridine diphosphokinase
MAYCLLALGANLGPSRQHIEQALEAIDATTMLKVASVSAIHRTKPVGGPANQVEFANAVAVVETPLAPRELLVALQDIEHRFGRQRGQRWAERTLDLDLLLVDDRVIDSPELTLPHPRMSYRRFVLDPAVEIAADWRHPVLAATLRELQRRLREGDEAVLFYDGTADDRRWHAERLAMEFPALSVEVSDRDVYLYRGPSGAATAPKLAIHLCQAGATTRQGIPTLAIPSTSREEVVFDTIAAVICVWPDLCLGPADG